MKKITLHGTGILISALGASVLTGFIVRDLTRGDKLWEFYGWPVSCYQRGGIDGSSFYIESASRFALNLIFWIGLLAIPWIAFLRVGNKTTKPNHKANRTS